MDVTRLEEAQRYDAPGHFEMRSLRLQGLGASSADFAWAGLSYFLPGGGADMASGPVGKIYVVIEGTVTVVMESGEETRLEPLDSCFIPAGEGRAIRNDTNTVATMLVVMQAAPGTGA